MDTEMRARLDSTLSRMLDEPDWAPRGGTSNARHHKLADAHTIAFVALLRAAVDATPGMWLKGGAMQLRCGFTDDPGGGYFIAWGIVHEIRQAPETLPGFVWLQYSHETEDGTMDRYERVGETTIQAPFSFDPALSASLVMAWALAHHRTVTA